MLPADSSSPPAGGAPINPPTLLAALGPPYTVVCPTAPLPGARRLIGNDALAESLGLAAPWWHGSDADDVLAGNRPWSGYAPRATAYAGHQFGRYTRELGDGRAVLIAELEAPEGLMELQLKGAGPTPFARGSDGRAVLRSSVREYLASEAMHALGVPTTRALSLIGSHLPVQRERVETAAVVCRVAPSFLRFGHFEYHARSGHPQALAVLANHVIAQHHAHLSDCADAQDRHARWLTEVVTRQAELVAAWQTLGFCHGVFNTDNCSILGLTLDYGPFGFMERYRTHHVCNDSDTEGRYAYRAQPAVGRWNCARLIDACLGLLGDEPEAAAERAREIHPVFERVYNRAVMRRWCAKLGLTEVRDGDAALVNGLLTQMQHSRCDFTQTFRALGRTDIDSVRATFCEPLAFDAWYGQWGQRSADEGARPAEQRERMRRTNPLYVLRNHLAQAAVAAAEAGDASELQRLAGVLRRPYDEQPHAARYAQAAAADEPMPEVSCSS
jgi:uncharacterized protein YdiU (UPF0061 family)